MNFFSRRRPDTVVFECVRLKGLDKLGVIKPDKDGCYTQVIGGLNAHNSSGHLYDLNAGVQFFKDDSSFMRKIGRGVLRAEMGHPKKSLGMRQHEYVDRLLRIEETLVCGTWRKIWLSNEDIKDNLGRKIIPIMGSIYPSGPYKDSLVHGFESPGEQVCFSIRSFTNDTPRPDGTMLKKLLNIITFDYVNEPGMYNAEKLLSPSMESIEEVAIDANDIVDVIKENSSTISLEDSGNREFMNALYDILDKEKQGNKPSFTRW